MTKAFSVVEGWVPVGEPTILTLAVNSKSTKSMSMIEPTIRLKPASDPIETPWWMRKGTIEVPTLLARGTSHSSTFAGRSMVSIVVSIAATIFIDYHVVMTSFLYDLSDRIFFFSVISFARMLSWVFEYLGDLVVR